MVKILVKFIFLISVVFGNVCFDGSGNYVGSKSVTKSGLKCKRWDTVPTEMLSLYKASPEHHNYCQS